MRYGSSNPNDVRSEKDLGRYGLGLKTASLSQCKIMTVMSKSNGKFSACRWDLDEINENWTLLILEESECKDLPEYTTLKKMHSGTVVLWQNIDFGGSFEKVDFSESLDAVKEHIALTFHRYLCGEEELSPLAIYYNKALIEPKDPFLQSAKASKHPDTREEKLDRGVIVRAYVLPHLNEMSAVDKKLIGIKSKTVKRSQGFYIYRNKRLITYGTWYSLKAQGEFFKLARIQVDIKNNSDFEWSLDVKKSVARPPKRLLEMLKQLVERTAKNSDDSHKINIVGRVRATRKQDTQPWSIHQKGRDISAVSINREYPIIKTLLENKVITEQILVLLEKTIPIDAIAFARGHETQLENEMSMEINFLLQIIKEVVMSKPAGVERSRYFDMLLNVEPFGMHKMELIKHKESVCAL